MTTDLGKVTYNNHHPPHTHTHALLLPQPPSHHRAREVAGWAAYLPVQVASCSAAPAPNLLPEFSEAPSRGQGEAGCSLSSPSPSRSAGTSHTGKGAKQVRGGTGEPKSLRRFHLLGRRIILPASTSPKLRAPRCQGALQELIKCSCQAGGQSQRRTALMFELPATSGLALPAPSWQRSPHR